MLNKFQIFGQNGEAIALKFLKNKGYEISATNFRCRFGELDIIAFDGSCLVIVEVKTRSSDKYGCPASSVDFRKQQQISKAAHVFLTENNIVNCDIRFDVIGIFLQKSQNPLVEHITNAFEFCL